MIRLPASRSSKALASDIVNALLFETGFVFSDYLFGYTVK
jgi:hypothetical protein